MCIDMVFYRWDGRLGIFLGWRIGVGCAGTGRFLFGMSTCTGIPGFLYYCHGGYCSLFCSSTRNGTVIRTWADSEGFFFSSGIR